MHLHLLKSPTRLSYEDVVEALLLLGTPFCEIMLAVTNSPCIIIITFNISANIFQEYLYIYSHFCCFVQTPNRKKTMPNISVQTYCCHIVSNSTQYIPLHNINSAPIDSFFNSISCKM